MGMGYSVPARDEDGVVPITVPQPADPHVTNQTFVVEGTGDWGSGVHRSKFCEDGELIGILDPKETSLYEFFMRGKRLSGDQPCFGNRKVENGVAGDYTFLTYNEFHDWFMAIGSAIKHLGVNRGDKIGIYAKNCMEWVAVEHGCNAFTLPTVAIYDTFGMNAVRYIINHAELSVVFVEASKLSVVLSLLPEGLPTLKHVISFGDVSQSDVEEFGEYGVTVTSMEDFRKLGEANLREADPPHTDDVAIVMYTSGTTGNPKGVVITHFNMVSQCNAVVTPVVSIVTTDVYFSFLPLAHCFERIVHAKCMWCGACVGFFQGDVRKLPDDIATLRPTIFIAVPRVFNRFYEKILQTIESKGPLARAFFHKAYATRLAALKQGQDTPWLNYLLFDKIKQSLGGRVRFMVSGSAPLDVRVHEFLKVCLCPATMQGYGLTETCAASCVQMFNDTDEGTIGHPLPANEFKLVDVEDMAYRTSDNPPRGELCIRGNSVFKCYYKDEEKTKADKDADGWFHTGDIGQWNECGTLSIIDRKKNIFKLAQGEYIAVESLEMVYIHSPHIAQIFVYGDSLKSFLLAVVVPDEPLLLEWATKQGLEGDFATLCKSPAVRELLEMEMNEQAKIVKLKGFELVKGIIVHPKLFTEEDDLMTPTSKIKRPVAAKVFKSQFDQLYAELEAKDNK